MISNSREKIGKMCGQLSVLNQKFEIRKSECDLNEIVAATLSNLNLNGALATDLNPLPKTLLDAEQMQTVILNLVLNADESMAHNGETRVETCRDKDKLVLSVIDNGSGMSNEFIKKDLFRPFTTTKNNGSGIGLYQSRKIVEAHGGTIEVQSLEGSGSTFRVILPVA
jgi:signal transduction histidine kinase